MRFNVPADRPTQLIPGKFGFVKVFMAGRGEAKRSNAKLDVQDKNVVQAFDPAGPSAVALLRFSSVSSCVNNLTTALARFQLSQSEALRGLVQH